MQFLQTFAGLFANFGNLTWQMVVMWVIGGLLIYLAIAKKMEPSLLLPMGFGAILVNLPNSGAAEVIAQNVVKAYTSNGATLSVLLYLRAFEDGDFDSAWAIGAVLLVLVLAINLAARLTKTKLKQKQ